MFWACFLIPFFTFTRLRFARLYRNARWQEFVTEFRRSASQTMTKCATRPGRRTARSTEQRPESGFVFSFRMTGNCQVPRDVISFSKRWNWSIELRDSR